MKVIFLGVDNVQSPDFKLHRNPTEDYLFVLFKSPSVVLTKYGYKKASKGDCILYGKENFHSYYPESGEFVHDFIHIDFESEHEASYYSRIPLNKLMYLTNYEEISEILAEILKANHTGGKYRKEILNHLGHIFLLKLGQQIESEEKESVPYHKELIELRASIYNNPKKYHSIEDVIPEINLSASYLQLLYKKCFGISCMNDIINARLTLAKEMLKRYDMNVTEISEICGYNNVEHFIRQFKKFEGISPAKYKKQNRTTNRLPADF